MRCSEVLPAGGVFVSTHPDVIQRMGTKDVLVDLKDLPFESDTHRISHLDELREELSRRLEVGPRVLKQHRGHSGIGVWRVERIDAEAVRPRHAQRGSVKEQVSWQIFLETMSPYFASRRAATVFGHHDLNRALGYDLDRGSARRNLQLLIEDGVLAAEQSESGHVRILYRKLRATLPEVEE